MLYLYLPTGGSKVLAQKPINMKKSIILTGALLASQAFTPIYGQSLPQPSAPAPASPAGGGNSGGGTTVNRNSKQAPSPVGNEIPVYDPAGESFTFLGKTYSMADGPWLSQFDGYLASSTKTDDEAGLYRKQIKEILQLLSPLNKTDPRAKFNKAQVMLNAASAYRGDNNICQSLNNALVSAKNAKNVVGKNDRRVAELIQQRNSILRKLTIAEERTNLSVSGGGNGSGAAGEARPQRNSGQSAEYKQMEKEIKDIDTSIKKLKAEGALSQTLGKVEYQALLMQLFTQRRFEHVVIGCRLYNLVFTDGGNKLVIKKGSDVDELFSKSFGVNPTVAGLDSASNEVIGKTSDLVDAFQNNLKMNQTESGAKRLVEAFFIGEHLTAVQTVATEDKLRVQKYLFDANKLIAAADARNMDLAKEMNESLKEQADDYNYAKTDSIIAAVISASNGKITKCWSLLTKPNSEDKFEQTLGEAIALWPQNPKIKELQDHIADKIKEGQRNLNKLNIARTDFDGYHKFKQYDQIMSDDNIIRFGALFGGSPYEEDAERLSLFKQVKVDYQGILTIVETASAQTSQGFDYAAWETLREGKKSYPKSTRINDLLTQVNSKVPEYTGVIKRAEDALKAKNLGTAMSYYLQAREMHQTSQIVKDGLNKILEYKLEGKSIKISSNN